MSILSRDVFSSFKFLPLGLYGLNGFIRYFKISTSYSNIELKRHKLVIKKVNHIFYTAHIKSYADQSQ